MHVITNVRSLALINPGFAWCEYVFEQKSAGTKDLGLSVLRKSQIQEYYKFWAIWNQRIGLLLRLLITQETIIISVSGLNHFDLLEFLPEFDKFSIIIWLGGFEVRLFLKELFITF